MEFIELLLRYLEFLLKIPGNHVRFGHHMDFIQEVVVEHLVSASSALGKCLGTQTSGKVVPGQGSTSEQGFKAEIE